MTKFLVDFLSESVSIKVQVHVCSELQSMQVYNCIRENEDISQTCCNKSLSGLNKYDVVTLRL